MNLEIEKKVVFLDDISEILNYDFIRETVGWCNHGDPMTVFNNGKINKWVYFNNDSNEIKEFEFDEVICGGMHGFGGTSYDYFFRMNNDNVNIGYNNFAPTIDKLKLLKIEEINNEVKRIDNLIESKKSLLDKIKRIEAL
jgi:hypothetical protein